MLSRIKKFAAMLFPLLLTEFVAGKHQRIPVVDEPRALDLSYTMINSAMHYQGVTHPILSTEKLTFVSELPLHITFELRIEKIIGASKATSSNPEFTKVKANIMRGFVHIYQNNLIDQCKLEELLAWDGFKITIVTQEEERINFLNFSENQNARYFEIDQEILLIVEKFINYNSGMVAVLTHELRHAIDACFNFKNGVNSHLYGDKIYHSSDNYGDRTVLTAFPAVEESKTQTDRNDLMQLIELDVRRLKKLLDFVNSDHQSLSAKEKKFKNKLYRYLKNYGYQLQKISFPVAGNDFSSFIAMAKQYQFSYDGYCYRRSNESFKTMDGDYVEEVCPQDKYILVTKVNPKTPTLKLLATDLINTLLNKLEFIKQFYEIKKHTLECGAYFEEFLAPYSHRLQSKIRSFSEWLLPQFSRHQQRRESKTFKECMRNRNTLFALNAKKKENSFGNQKLETTKVRSHPTIN